jgi:outer membrane lipoprotein SlyB
MKLARNVGVASILVVSMAMGGCATSQTANTYTSSQVMAPMEVLTGTVISIRDVNITREASGAGGLAGAGIGGVAGAQMGNGSGSIAGALVGALVGGVVGVVADKAANSSTGEEIIYKDDATGKTMALVQQKDPNNVIAVNDKIRIMSARGTTRAIKM